ncbi:DUF397 domain-containing protein [Streptomyces montanus]|uniref:DUF397 domain-containing protein n=1 Tax=Streptomyces montanus TaxID=2580423 RepID=A0A5R9FWF5_9ACTN|nr:DUF397 domain-containing protein [Streptomyces montanus]TLS44804.1 DUF397 domain-containing protein [Streptomyces montanus]
MSVGLQSVSEPVWFKSSYSGGNTTECVEAAFIPSGVLVRDSKRPGHHHLTVSAASWADFLAGVAALRRGEPTDC